MISAMSAFGTKRTLALIDTLIDGHQRRNDRAADIDRDHSAVPIAHDGHGVAHAVEIDDLIGHDVLWRQLRDRDVEEAAD